MAKRALLAGINNYANPSFTLNGCVNDVESFAALLREQYGFGAQDIRVLVDREATGHAILSHLEALVSDASEGDVLVFGYAGHGTYYTDPKDAGAVEAIVPYETVTTANLLSNAAINAIVRNAIGSRGLSGAVNFTAVYDCCHSGRMFRDLTATATGELVTGIVNRVLDISRLFPPPKVGIRDVVLIDDMQTLSACGHDETAADLSPQPDWGVTSPRGAFSFVLHDMLRHRPSMSLAELETQVTGPIAKLVAPHVQKPVFAMRGAWKDKGIFTI